MIIDTVHHLNSELRAGKTVLAEGIDLFTAVSR